MNIVELALDLRKKATKTDKAKVAKHLDNQLQVHGIRTEVARDIGC